ncbi:AAA family ATPase (plasmid) [Cupriavidus sp. P-10]|uniref:ATP-binding protein n=1 Tax=Cupriavidus sp. P-10 TaxID=2027911 RepID=UPI001314164E|nr:ATP-binding protein [Cupriavidus sp. P-10]BDB29150.1 AAA family ATPase [Cupriavidus sp. P-10]
MMMSETNADGFRSPLQTGTHPLLAHETNSPLWTPPIIHAYAACKLCILQRRSFYISEVRGEGKTSFLRALREQLANDFENNFAILSYSAANRHASSIRAYFIEFLRSVDHPTLTGETARLKARVGDTLVVLASMTLWKMVVLLLDEAQAFLPEDFGFLKDIQNELEKKGLSLTVVTCGEEPFMKNMLTTMIEKGPAGACADRFGLHRVRLRGYDKDSLRVVLRAVDSKIWPPGSECTWTQYFFPNAFSDGFRFQNHVDDLWAAFTEFGQIRKKKIEDENGYKFEEYLLSRRIFEALPYLAVRVTDDDFDRGCLKKKFWTWAAAHAAGKLDD